MLKNFFHRLLDLINTFSKVAGYKIRMQKSVVFLCASNEQAEKANNPMYKFHFIASKKYLGET
jgi:hypothetical protein